MSGSGSVGRIMCIESFCLATTHFNGLKSYAKKQDNILISGVEFDLEQMKPTYRYLEVSAVLPTHWQSLAVII